MLSTESGQVCWEERAKDVQLSHLSGLLRRQKTQRNKSGLLTGLLVSAGFAGAEHLHLRITGSDGGDKPMSHLG